MSKALLREKIAGAADKPKEMVDVPEWGGIKIEMRGLSARERAVFYSKSAEGKENRAHQFEVMQPDLIITLAHDPETGERLFTDADRDMLLDRNPGVLDRLFKAGMRASGMDSDAIDEAGKGSAPTQSGASSSD